MLPALSRAPNASTRRAYPTTPMRRSTAAVQPSRQWEVFTRTMPLLTRSFSPGEVIAQKYLLLQLLGRGASGEVFRARNLLAGNVLALKLFIEDPGRDSELVRRFLREGRAINRISHPNIVSVFDAGYAEAIPFMAMEYLGGETLAQVLDRSGRLPFACVVAILLRILDALEAAHKADVVHRDLKPANVFLQVSDTGPPRVKLVDFGIAKIHEEGELSIQTESGMILGTPDYLSPEQITGSAEVDGRSDLFAAGSLMFEMLTGKRPFHGPTVVTTTYRIVHEPAPSLAEAGGPDDPRVARVLAKALCKDPGGRFSSAAEFAHHLAEIAPDASARDAALLDLGVRAPSVLDHWDTPSEPIRAASEDGPRGDTSRRWPVVPESARPTPPARVEPVRAKLSRTWSELPIIGKGWRRRDPAGGIRGAVLVAMDRAIATRYGGDVRDEIVGALPRETRDIFRAGPLSADAWYSVSQVAAYLESCNRVAVHDDGSRWHALGYAGVETDLRTLLRSARSQPDGYVALREVLPILQGLFDFGQWGQEGDPQRVRVVAGGLARTPPSLHDWLGGVIEQAARSTGRPYRVFVQREPNADGEGAAVQFTVSLVG